MTAGKGAGAIAIVLVGVALMAAGPAWTQVGGSSGGRGTSPGAGGATPHLPAPIRPAPDANVPLTMLQAVQYRLELLEEDLRLRPDQNVAWLAYRERVLKLAEDMQRSSRSALAGDLTAGKRFDRLVDLARDRLTAIEDIADAGNSLYATMSPSQQSLADRRMAVPILGLVGVEPNTGNRSGPPPKNP